MVLHRSAKATSRNAHAGSSPVLTAKFWKSGRVAKVTSLENWRDRRKAAPGVEFPSLPPLLI